MIEANGLCTIQSQVNDEYCSNVSVVQPTTQWEERVEELPARFGPLRRRAESCTTILEMVPSSECLTMQDGRTIEKSMAAAPRWALEVYRGQ